MAEASLFALDEEIVVTDSSIVRNFVVEVLADDQTFVPFPEVRAVAASRQILTQAPVLVPVQDYKIEVLADDTSFEFPEDLKAVAASRMVLVQPPFDRPVSNYVVEVLATVELDPLPQIKLVGLDEEIVVSEIPTPTVQDYVVEVLGAGALEQEVSSYIVEVLADDTTPNSVQRYAVEVLADSTDDVALTRQSIIWFFNDH